MTIYARHAAFCSEVEQFDAPAFRLTKPEGVVTDPQQRLLMEKCAEALHQASAFNSPANSSTGQYLLVIICLTNDFLPNNLLVLTLYVKIAMPVANILKCLWTLMQTWV